MSEFLTKIENFLFDILGLVLPGVIFMIVALLPLALYQLLSIPQACITNSYTLSWMSTANTFYLKLNSADLDLLIATGLVTAYLLGHVVKVLSIILYDFLSVLFDRTLIKAVNWLFEKFKTVVNWPIKKITSKDMYDYKVYSFIKQIFSPFKSTLSKVFTFESSNYFSDNDSLRTDCIRVINDRLGTNYPDKWYSLYKFSSIITSQENLKTLASHFLAKYNLYRSLSATFLFATIYFGIFISQAGPYLPPDFSKITPIVIGCSAILWFTFNYKYKRYWTLCGNETLVSLFYFLNKKKLNER